MLYFRQPRERLEDSLKTIIEVSSLEELKNYLQEIHIFPVSDLKCEYYCEDRRLEEWNKTYIITGKVGNTWGTLGYTNGLLV